MGTNPAGFSIIVSGTVKTVLLALVALHTLPLSPEQVGAIVLAVAGVADAALYLGLVRPKLAQTIEDVAQPVEDVAAAVLRRAAPAEAVSAPEAPAPTV